MFSYYFTASGKFLCTGRHLDELPDLEYFTLMNKVGKELVALNVPDDGSCPQCYSGDVFDFDRDFTKVSCDVCTFSTPLKTLEEASQDSATVCRYKGDSDFNAKVLDPGVNDE